MRVDQILYLNLVSARLRAWNGTHFEQVCDYPPDDEGVARFSDFLDQDPDRVTAVFIDIVQEEHYRDTMPHLRRADQLNLLTRKTAKAFGKTPYRTGAVQGRDGKSRDNDRVLLSGVTRPEALRPWMQVLFEHKTPVAGIFSPAMLSHALLTKLDATSDATLLVTQRFDGRYRHTFLDGKHLIGSRLLRKHTGAENESAEEFARQLDESQQYFNPSFAPATGSKLEAVIICAASTAEELGRAAAATINFKLRFIDVGEAGRRIGVDRQLSDTDSGYLFGQLLRNSRPSGNLAPPRDLRYNRFHRTRSYAKAACLALIGIGLVTAGLTTIRTINLNGQANAAMSAAQQAEQTFDLHSKSLPELETDPFEMKGAVNAYNQLVANNVSPIELFSAISKAMDNFPRIQVDGVEWSADQRDAAASETGEALAVASAGAAGRRVAMSLDGRVTPFDGDYTAAFAEIDRFAEKLTQQTEIVSVSLESMPLDIDPRANLVGEVATTEKRDEALFSLKLVISTDREKV